MSTDNAPMTQDPRPTTASRKGIGGPKTPEGKRRSKLNAFKTGIWAESYEGNKMIAEKIGVSFETILQDMTADYHPIDAEERILVRRIARCTWRLLVLEIMEDHILENTRLRKSPGKSLEQISVIERRTDVQLHRAITALKAKRKAEHENVKNELKELRKQRDPSARVLKDAFRARQSLDHLARSPGLGESHTSHVSHMSHHSPTQGAAHPGSSSG